MRILFIAPFALLWLLLWHSWFGPDIFYHLTWGRSLLANLSFMPVTQTLVVQPIFANGYWLFQILVSALFSAGGIYAVSLLFLLLWTAIAWLWLRETGAMRSGFAGLMAFLAFVICAQLRFEARPEIFSYLFLIAEIYVLCGAEERSLVALFSLQVLWTNCHGYFVLGPLLGAALIVARIWEGRVYDLKRPAKIFAVLTIACFVSPFPIGNWRSVAAYIGVSRALADINQELQAPALFPLSWPLTLFWLYWFKVSAWSLWCLIRRRASFAALLALGGAILSAQATRNIPVFFLMSAPMVGQMLKLSAVKKIPQALNWVAAGFALVLCVTVVRGDYHQWEMSLGTFGVKLEPSAYPIGVSKFLASKGFSGKLFCDSYDGGYLEYTLPGIKVAGDSYFSDGPATLSYFAAIRDPRALRAMDREFQFDALVINVENIEVMDALWDDPVWHPVYADSHRAVFAKELSRIAFAEGKFFGGEDLKHWANAFGVSTWSGLALRHGDTGLMIKLLKDLNESPTVPQQVVKFATVLAERARSQELLDLAQAASARAAH